MESSIIHMEGCRVLWSIVLFWHRHFIFMKEMVTGNILENRCVNIVGCMSRSVNLSQISYQLTFLYYWILSVSLHVKRCGPRKCVIILCVKTVHFKTFAILNSKSQVLGVFDSSCQVGFEIEMTGSVTNNILLHLFSYCIQDLLLSFKL